MRQFRLTFNLPIRGTTSSFEKVKGGRNVMLQTSSHPLISRCQDGTPCTDRPCPDGDVHHTSCHGPSLKLSHLIAALQATLAFATTGKETRFGTQDSQATG
jgi:hypothetical protein